MRRLLSIDIGLKNLGWCVLDTGAASPPAIVSVACSDVQGATIRDALDNALALFRPLAADVDVVLIEQQPLKHAKMLSIMHGLYGALRVLDKPVYIVSPQLRIKFLGLDKDASYAQRKRASVRKVQQLYGDVVNAAKADDMADAVVQALAWLARK